MALNWFILIFDYYECAWEIKLLCLPVVNWSATRDSISVLGFLWNLLYDAECDSVIVNYLCWWCLFDREISSANNFFYHQTDFSLTLNYTNPEDRNSIYWKHILCVYVYVFINFVYSMYYKYIFHKYSIYCRILWFHPFKLVSQKDKYQ